MAKVVCSVPEQPVEAVVAAGGSALLIGDRALRLARLLPPETQVYDLGELWYGYTGLPFVFALWIVRQAAFAEQPEAIRTVRAQLARSLSLAYADLAGMAAAAAPDAPLSVDELVSYWKDSMSYNLSPDHLAGLRLFFSLCCKYGVLAEEPELRFAD